MPSHDFTLNGPLGHFYPNVIPGAKIGGIPRRVSQSRTIESIAQARLHGLGTSKRKQEEELSETRPPDGPEKGLAFATTRSDAKKTIATKVKATRIQASGCLEWSFWTDSPRGGHSREGQPERNSVQTPFQWISSPCGGGESTVLGNEHHAPRTYHVSPKPRTPPISCRFRSSELA